MSKELHNFLFCNKMDGMKMKLKPQVTILYAVTGHKLDPGVDATERQCIGNPIRNLNNFGPIKLLYKKKSLPATNNILDIETRFVSMKLLGEVINTFNFLSIVKKHKPRGLHCFCFHLP